MLIWLIRHLKDIIQIGILNIEIDALNMQHALTLTAKQYDNMCSEKGVVDLYLITPQREFIPLYHVDKGKEGIYFDTLKKIR